MAVNFRSFVAALACISMLGLVGLVSAQAPAPTADRPHLAKDTKEAMDFLATWARVTSGEEYFKGATYVGSEGCKGQWMSRSADPRVANDVAFENPHGAFC